MFLVVFDFYVNNIRPPMKYVILLSAKNLNSPYRVRREKLYTATKQILSDEEKYLSYKVFFNYGHIIDDHIKQPSIFKSQKYIALILI